MVNLLRVDLWVSVLPSVAAAVIPSLTAILLMYERAVTTARIKLRYLAKEVTPLVSRTTGWSFYYISSKNVWPALDRIRTTVREHRRFVAILSFLSKAFATLVEQSCSAMQLLMQEQEKIHAEIRRTPEGQKLGQRYSNLDQKIDEVLASLVNGQPRRPNPEVNRAVKPLLERDPARLDGIKRYWQLLDENLGSSHERIKHEWETFLRENYVHVPS